MKKKLKFKFKEKKVKSDSGNALKNVGQKIAVYFDDILFICGISSLSISGFCLNESVGFAITGIGLIAYALIIARSRR